MLFFLILLVLQKRKGLDFIKNIVFSFKIIIFSQFYVVAVIVDDVAMVA